MTTHPFAGKRVAVVMGGLSAEREVSLNTGAGVLKALGDKGWDAVGIDWKDGGPELPQLLADARAQVVWNALHGTWGEDGAVQGLCYCLRIPCTGSGILASALAMDKVMSKRIFESNGVPTPRWRVLGAGASPGSAGARSTPLGSAESIDDERSLADFPLPLVIKPANEGSSVGVSIVEERDQVAAAIALARQHHGPVIVEEYIAGTEVFVGILDGRALGSVEVRPATKFYDYEAKYKRTDTKYLIPPELSADVLAHAERHALAAYTALGCSGHARPDLRITHAGEVYVLEVNTLPGMTATSLLPKIAKSIGMDYATLCEQVLASAK
jgi:D-alanine-D-alanine ligase